MSSAPVTDDTRTCCAYCSKALPPFVDGMCTACQADLALPPGEWINDGRVMRWVPSGNTP